MPAKHRLPTKARIRHSPVGAILRSWPFLPWLAAVLFGLVLYSRSADYTGVKGVVEKSEETVAPTEDGRLHSVLVKVGDQVIKGQALAQLDDSLIDAEIAMQEALLTYETSDGMASYKDNIIGLLQQVNRSISEALATLAKERRSLAEAVAELEVLDRDLRRLDGLLKKGLVDATSMSSMRARQAALRSSVEMFPTTIKLYQEHIDESREQAKLLKSSLQVGNEADATALFDKQQEIRRKVHETQIDLLKARKQNHRLYASRDGTVARLLQQPGDIVGPQAPVMSIVNSNATHVVAFLPESRSNQCTVGMKAFVQRMGDRPIEARVVAIAPDIVWLPLRVSAVRTQQGSRGRRIRLALDSSGESAVALVPGETLEVLFPELTSFIARRIKLWSRRPSGKTE
jgi:HlyD family secretion protein